MSSGERRVDFSRRGSGGGGFTLIELVVVMALVGLLLSIAAPRFLGSIDKGRENVRRQNIAALRGAIDQFRADSGRYPETLDELVARRYLREVPLDPVTERSDWRIVPPQEPEKGVYDVQPPEAAAGGAN
ncbi:MAG: prepilin-type N-terminal cleavage/methylation domain-containing protein [Rubrivivax sp.]|nr:prepilin-type N-terminal cleavage/methylation domain-containing protein [Rubrivivax sp.]